MYLYWKNSIQAMEIKTSCSFMRNLLIDGANSILVAALLIYPITWVLSIFSDNQQEVDFELYVNYVLLAFFGKQLGRLFLLLGSRLSKKKKDSFWKWYTFIWRNSVPFLNSQSAVSVDAWFYIDLHLQVDSAHDFISRWQKEIWKNIWWERKIFVPLPR